MDSIRLTDYFANRLEKGRPTGVVRLYGPGGWRRGTLLWERENLVVNSALVALASLLAGVTTGQSAAAVGFGSGSTPPAATDTDLSATPKYYNAVTAHTIGPAGGIASGSVQFSYGLTTADYAANPLTVQELGLFAGLATLPAAVGTANPSWAASTAYGLNALIVDSNSNIQRASTAGTSGASAPTWATSIGNTTTDGSVTWTLVALHTAPTPMIAHVTVPAFPYSGGGNYSGTWTISM